MPIKVSLTHGRSQRWGAGQLFSGQNIQETSTRNSTSFGQTLYARKKEQPSAFVLREQKARARTETRARANSMFKPKSAAYVTTGVKNTARPVIQYLAAGQSWCGYSRQQKAILEHPSNRGKTQVQYMDCSKGEDCNIIKYGRHNVESLNEHVQADQQQQQ